jgi:hypothetical protein
VYVERVRVRGVVVLFALVAGCSRRDDGARSLPEAELARAAPSVAPVPQCEPACEAGAACIDGLCAEAIDWARAALPTAGSCPVGQRHAVSCAKTATAIASVWGSDVYTTDSSVCRAALHAGKITSTGGEVVFEIRPGLPSYDRSSRNGVTTDSWAAYECSFVFTSKGCGAGLSSCGAACANLKADAANCGACGVACAAGESCRKGVCSPGLDADYTTVAGNPCTGSRTYVCPPLAGATVGSVWGTGVYTHDSSVCGAALHAGAITTSGGTVTIDLLPGLPAYPGTTRHGISSNSWASWSCSFRFK